MNISQSTKRHTILHPKIPFLLSNFRQESNIYFFCKRTHLVFPAPDDPTKTNLRS